MILFGIISGFVGALIYTVDSTGIPEIEQAARVRGVCARIAKQLSLSHEHVRQVALGNRTSNRVTVALRDEMKRIARAAGRKRAA